MSVHISIGNSDDKLTQVEWEEFWRYVNDEVKINSSRIYGVWCSLPNAAYQNACWCFDPLYPEMMKPRLAKLATRYRQDSVAWADAPATLFLGEASHPQNAQEGGSRD